MPAPLFLPAILAALSAASGPPASTPRVPGQDGLVVHEWGTFTSFSGSDGVLMDHPIQIGEHLPEWVQARAFGDHWLQANSGDFIKFSAVALQRMETPVIYFYTDKPLEVSAGVTFPKGLVTEVFPPVSSWEPRDLKFPEDRTVPEGGSSIRWDKVSLQPPYCCDSLTFLDAGKSHYAAARATDSAIVTVGSGRSARAEKFLFYRGIADCELGLGAVALGQDRFRLTRSDNGALAAAFILEKSGERIRFARRDDLKPGEELRLPAAPAAPAPAGTPQELSSQMVAALTSAGLLEREAQAMVETWKALWFGEDGTRLLVIVPQKTIDRVLPLQVAPTPVETKRVFVARFEMLTPEREQQISLALAKQDAGGAGKNAADAELGTLGRFAGPAITHVRRTMGPKN